MLGFLSLGSYVLPIFLVSSDSSHYFFSISFLSFHFLLFGSIVAGTWYLCVSQDPVQFKCHLFLSSKHLEVKTAYKLDTYQVFTVHQLQSCHVSASDTARVVVLSQSDRVRSFRRTYTLFLFLVSLRLSPRQEGKRRTEK